MSTDNSLSEVKSEAQKQTEPVVVPTNVAPTTTGPLSVSTAVESTEKGEEMDVELPEENEGDSRPSVTIDPLLYRSIQFLSPLPSGSNVSKSVTAKWKVLEAEIEQCIARNGRVLKIDIHYSLRAPTAGMTFRRGAGGGMVDVGGIVSRIMNSSVGMHPSYGAGGGAGEA